MNYLSIDVGTTCCKCQLFSETGEILVYKNGEYPLKNLDGEIYVNIDAILERVFSMMREISTQYEFSSVCISTIGESFVLLDKNDKVLFYPMLYTDSRGEIEAEELCQKFGKKKMYEKTGVLPQSMYSICKLLWIKKNYPDIFKKADKALLMCDYLGYVLTGERVIDYALASRTGVFDIEKKVFDNEILSECGISASLFSKPMLTGSVVGKLKEDIRKQIGLNCDCTLVLGSHDQICAAVGAGVLNAGDAVDGMGTVECITAVFANKATNLKMGEQGFPCVPFAVDGLYCTYVLNYSNGSVVSWFKDEIMHGFKGEEENFFKYIEKNISDKPTGILTLPYFGGAATPYQNINAKGAIINLQLQTKDCDLYRSIMEGTSMEMRLNCEVVEEYGIKVETAVATGGGANSDKWLQIKADIQNIPYKTLRSSEGGLCGCAMFQAVAMKKVENLSQAAQIFVQYKKEFTPVSEKHAEYGEQYKKYKKLYQVIKEFN